MGKPNKVINSGDVDLRQIDNAVVDIYTPKGMGYPIIERTTNALLWPEEIKGGIDLEDTANVTQVPEDPFNPLTHNKLTSKKF